MTTLHVRPVGEEAQVQRICDLLNASTNDATKGKTFAMWVDEQEDGTRLYGIGFFENKIAHAPARFFPDAASLLAHLTREQA